MYDAACGTGNMTLALRKLGLIMSGADISDEMLAQASGKSRRLGLQIPWIHQDIRAIRTHRPLDAVVCACDGVNHLMSDADILKFLHGAYNALRPGGTLAFDISSAYKLSRILGCNTFGEDKSDVCYLWNSNYDEATHVCQMDLTFFSRIKSRQENGSSLCGADCGTYTNDTYKCFRETIIQKAHDAGHLQKLMEGSGFSRVAAYGDMTLLPDDGTCERIHIVGQR